MYISVFLRPPDQKEELGQSSEVLGAPSWSLCPCVGLPEKRLQQRGAAEENGGAGRPPAGGPWSPRWWPLTSGGPASPGQATVLLLPRLRLWDTHCWPWAARKLCPPPWHPEAQLPPCFGGSALAWRRVYCQEGEKAWFCRELCLAEDEEDAHSLHPHLACSAGERLSQWRLESHGERGSRDFLGWGTSPPASAGCRLENMGRFWGIHRCAAALAPVNLGQKGTDSSFSLFYLWRSVVTRRQPLNVTDT